MKLRREKTDWKQVWFTFEYYMLKIMERAEFHIVVPFPLIPPCPPIFPQVTFSIAYKPL